MKQDWGKFWRTVLLWIIILMFAFIVLLIIGRYANFYNID